MKKIVLLALVLAITLSAFGASAKKNQTLSGVININSASAEELMMIPGIGKTRADEIVSFRGTEQFSRPEDLIKVKGVGPKLFENIKGFVTVDGPTTAKYVELASTEGTGS